MSDVPFPREPPALLALGAEPGALHRLLRPAGRAQPSARAELEIITTEILSPWETLPEEI